jgi:hypothetical protein
MDIESKRGTKASIAREQYIHDGLTERAINETFGVAILDGGDKCVCSDRCSCALGLLSSSAAGLVLAVGKMIVLMARLGSG